MPLLPEAKNCDSSVKENFRIISSKLGLTAHTTHASITLNHTGIGDQLTLSKVCTVATGLNVLRVTGLQTDNTALTGTLRGAYIDVSNGSTEATGTIRAMELKARTEAPGDTGSKVAVLEGLSISADSKAHDVTTMRAAEFILDGKTAGTIDEAVGLRIANNLQVDKATLSYGLQIYRDSFDYTYDISLSLGGHITGGCYATQDYRTTASPTFANLSLGTGELTTGSINRAAGTLTLEIAGTAEISISSTTVTLGGNLVIPDTGYIGSVSDANAIQIAANGEVSFTDVATGILPTAGAHLATKEYVDLAIGASADFFLSNNDDAVIADYHILYETDTGEASSTLVTDPMVENDDQLMFSYITASGVPGVEFLRAGVYICHSHLSRGTGDKPTTFYWTLSKYTIGDVETVILTSEESSAIPDSTISFQTHATLAADTAILVTDRLVLKLYANVGAAGGNSEVTISMEGTHDSYLTNQLPSSIWQNQGDVLDDLNATGVNTFTGDPVNDFLVGTAAGTLVWQYGATVRTSMGVGTGDSPQFTGIELGHADDTTITRDSAGVIAVQGVAVMMVGGAPAAHSIASHNDTTGTGAELNTLTGGGDVGALHTHAAAYQPLDAVLTDLAALTAVANNEFIVGTGAGTYGHENAATAATSMGLGVGDSPTFSNLSVTNTFSIVDLLVTGDSQLGNTVNLDTIGINMAPDADVLIKGTFSSTGSGGTFCYNHETFAHTEDDSTAATYVRGTDSTMQVNDDISANGILAATGHRQFVETNLTTITGVGTPTAYLYGYHAVVDWAAAALSGATYAACVVGFKADVTGNLGTTGNTIKRGADIAVSESAVTNYGGKFTATGATYNYGLYGYTTGAHTTNWGLYGYAAGATTNWGLYVAAGNAYFAGDIVIVNNGTIGQAAGPLLTFDDTNNFLEITGCKVGNIATPLAALHFESSSYPVGKFVRTTTGTNTIYSGYQLLTRTSANMADAFGGGIILSIEDEDSGEQAIARIYAQRDGADNEGKLSLRAGTDGNEQFLTIAADGGIHVTGLKSGADQAGAGAAANELYHDTDDNTIKIGV